MSDPHGPAFLAVGAAYLGLIVAIVLGERLRIRRSGPDVITVFMVLFTLQTCVASVIICGTLPFVDRANATGIAFIDNIYRAADPTIFGMVFALTAAFVVVFYVGCAMGGLLLRPLAGTATGERFEMVVHWRRLMPLLLFGASFTTASFLLLGDTFIMRYANLILLRSDDLPGGRTIFTSNAFVLTQAWAWLAVIPLVAAAKRRGLSVQWWACLGLVLGFALMGVSRRAIFLPLLMAYLASVLRTGRWRIGWILATIGPIVFWVAFGKDLLSTIAYGGTVERALGVYESWVNALLRAASDIGTTVVESVGTLALIDLPPRWGVDHLLSVAQRVPEGFLGFEIDWPDRMVRVSTRAFIGEFHQDVPPGMMGQMWLDFRGVGPVAWGLVFGLQMAVVQHFWSRSARTAEAAVVFVIVTFMIALPVNSGSFDFSFGMDFIALALALYWCCHLRPVAHGDATDPARASAT